MTHDATKYPAPFEFKPERFFTSSGDLNDDQVTPIWGWGRRICVGRYVADASLWSAIASMLAVFDFLKATDENGKDIEFEPRWTSGIASYVSRTGTGMRSTDNSQASRELPVSDHPSTM